MLIENKKFEKKFWDNLNLTNFHSKNVCFQRKTLNKFDFFERKKI